MKICTKCKAEKPVEAFAADRSKSDGRKAQCKECVRTTARERYSSAKRSKAYYAASPQARSSRTIRQRNLRWQGLAAEHGERWLVEQVQTLKATGRLSWEAIDRAEKDERLAAFFREARRASPEALRTALDSRTWDRARGMSMAKSEWVALAMRSFTLADGKRPALVRAAALRASLEKRWPALGMTRDDGDDAPAICPNAPTPAELRREASDRILRKR